MQESIFQSKPEWSGLERNRWQIEKRHFEGYANESVMDPNQIYPILQHKRRLFPPQSGIHQWRPCLKVKYIFSVFIYIIYRSIVIVMQEVKPKLSNMKEN